MKLAGHWVLCLCAAAVACASVRPAFGWRSALYPKTWDPEAIAAKFESDKLIQDFSYAGYRCGERALPLVSGPVFHAVADYGADPTGKADSTAAIQKAIDAARAAGGGVVFLSAGTYRIVAPEGSSTALAIRGHRIVIRGEGPSRTFLWHDDYRVRGKNLIHFSPEGGSGLRGDANPRVLLTADVLTPTRVLHVADTSTLKVGDWIVVRADITTDWVNEHKESGWLGFERQLGSQAYSRQIVVIDSAARTITLDVPVRYYLKMRDSARVHPHGNVIEEVGLEELSVGNRQHPGTSGWGEEDYGTSGRSSYDVHGCDFIRFTRVRFGWMRNVRSYRPPGNSNGTHILSNGVRLVECRGMTLQGCKFEYPQYGGGGGNGYMYRIQDSGETLLVDCMAEFSRHGFDISHMASTGNVFLRCIDKNTGRATGATGSYSTGGSASDHHMHFSHSNLLDNCIADNSSFEAFYRPYGTPPLHNLTAAHSVFWNTRSRASSRSYVVYTQQGRYGYAIGTQGPITAVKTDGSSTAKTNPVDHVEGVGEGATLEPQSLYLDQFDQRLAASGRSSRVVNLSTRAVAGTGEKSLIVGFVIEGDAPQRILVRGVGPGLRAFGVADALSDLTMRVHQGAMRITENAGWSTAIDSAEIAELAAKLGAFALEAGSRDAALQLRLDPGTYTVQIESATSAAGVALVELYAIK